MSVVSKITELIKDEGAAEYLSEVLESAETAEEFAEIANPVIEGLDLGISEDEINSLSTKIFALKSPVEEEQQTTIETPIKMNELIGITKEEEKVEEKVEDQTPVTTSTTEVSTRTSERLKYDDIENSFFKKGIYFRHSLPHGPKDFVLLNLIIDIGPKVLIDEPSLNMAVGNRYGLVGRNGMGKTTFMRFINSRFIQQVALSSVPPDVSIVHVEQECPISNRTALQTVLDCDIERTELLEKLKDFETHPDNDPNEVHRVMNRLSEIGAKTAESRAISFLTALGFDTNMINSPVKDLSGGFRMRVSLAQALYINPDVLLLDEPTGHLDAPSICWLEEYLTTQCSHMVLVVISHDRIFLDNVCTHIIHLKDKRLTVYKGNYSSFERQFAEKCHLLEVQAALQKKAIDHKMDYVRRLGARAAFAKMAKSRLTSIKKMNIIRTISADEEINFFFPTGTIASTEEIIKLNNVFFQYNPSKVIFENLNITINRDSRIVVIGGNGAGKSTFIKLLTGKLSPNKGEVDRATNLRIAYFNQHHVDQLDYRTSPLDYMKSKFEGQYTRENIMEQLSKFGIRGDSFYQPIQSLSGGQKTRVVLAECALLRPHLLLLDEVTNNLDMDSIHALGEGLCVYDGAIVAVSHDQHFAELLDAQIYVCEKKNIIKYNGSFADYRAEVKDYIRETYFQKTDLS
ncbi:ATPase protein [Trichomonas vaginalis G3]|uniref:ATPase protein n=1 Tax=Trichomonas vaginalis (strain ATCC PRA-98 / G3) TaxID=412133 RepID=UPI0021E560C9|nr:ATPase protein [Trichomonas vaginalis G3]KAI5506460.1 ATPase protein [Trichomonas vaginalis G3]